MGNSAGSENTVDLAGANTAAGVAKVEPLNGASSIGTNVGGGGSINTLELLAEE